MARYIDADLIEYRRKNKIGLGIDYDIHEKDYYEYVYKSDIESIPTADVKPVVRGEWIEDGEGEIYCSKCGKYTYDRHDEIKEFDGKTVIALCYPRFCGNCGAMMAQECNT